MQPTPLYGAPVDQLAFQLRYSWTGWPSGGLFSACPTDLIERTKPLWDSDGLRLFEHRWTQEMVQILFSANPHVPPVFVAARAKGRLDHAIRAAGLAMPFSRKVALRSIGDNTRNDVEAYIARQVPKERFADADWAAQMAELTVENADVDLSKPAESARGRYWYNLHLVLIVQDRFHIADIELLRTIRDHCRRIAAKRGDAISRLAVMPDHLHAALRANIDQSPQEVGLSYQNNLAYLLGQRRTWADGFYVGTFSEYTMQAIRNVVRGRAAAAGLIHHPREADGV